ncbi:MAG: NADH-quinone oxidoreductase subunit J, partial [Chloroflexi bacterium]|nr:NADH-quinone oxidoreductase subunit J [Chloroflexota bacterium]
MTTVLVFFFILGGMALLGSVGTVASRNVVHAALSLVLALL